MYFDARSAKLLAPGSHIVVHGCPGLRLEASATRKTWTYRFRSPVTGKLKQVKIGGWPAMDVATAAARWSELRARRDGGEDLAVTRQVERAGVRSAPEVGYTLGQLVQDYAAGYLARMREPKGARAVRLRLEKALAKFSSLPVSAVSRRFVFDLIDGMSDTPVAARSVKTEMAAAWRYALDSGRIGDEMPNWWAEVNTLKLRSRGAVRDGVHKGTAKRVLSEDEIRRLFGCELGIFSQQVQDFLTLQLWTCTRGVEICQLRPEQLSEDGGVLWWTMPKALTKNRHRDRAGDLRVPLLGRAENLVRRLVLSAKGGWLFPSVSRKGVVQPQSQAYMQSKVNYYQPYSKSRPDHVRRRLEVSHWSPHDLRRTGRTMLAALGCPHEVGEAILGHVQPGVAGDYNLYAYDRERVVWLQALADRLESVISPGSGV